MKVHQFPFLADENIQTEIVLFLRDQSIRIRSLHDLDMVGSTDSKILLKAQEEECVILTQDRDFGGLVHTLNLKFFGIIYLRPGHFSATHHIETLRAILKMEMSLTPPFIIIGENSKGKVKIRIRENLIN